MASHTGSEDEYNDNPVLNTNSHNEVNETKTECLPPVKDTIKRRIQVALPSCEGVDLDELTDLVLESCPHVLTVGAEVEEKQPDSSPSGQAASMNVSTWEEWMQGTSSWTAALLRLTVEDAFQASDLNTLLRNHHPDLPFEVREPVRKAGDLGDSAEEWMLHVQQSWPPQRIGALTVYFPWHKRPSLVEPQQLADVPKLQNDQDEQENVELVLEGGAAFGSGEHTTTRLCINWLSRQGRERRQRQTNEKGEATRGWSLMDYGCGSAILALAGLRFGASSAVGADTDSDALRSARRNCALNNLSVDLYHVQTGSESGMPEDAETEANGLWMAPAESELQGRQFEATVANILAPILIRIAPRLAELTAPGGSLALSGILSFQAETVIAAFKPFFEEMRVEETEGEWVLITGVRSS